MITEIKRSGEGFYAGTYAIFDDDERALIFNAAKIRSMARRVEGKKEKVRVQFEQGADGPLEMMDIIMSHNEGTGKILATGECLKPKEMVILKSENIRRLKSFVRMLVKDFKMIKEQNGA